MNNCFSLIRPPLKMKSVSGRFVFIFSLVLLLTSPLFGVSVKDFGAVGNGSSDDTSDFEDAMRVAARQRTALWIPEGRINIRGNIEIDRAVSCVGAVHELTITSART